MAPTPNAGSSFPLVPIDPSHREVAPYDPRFGSGADLDDEIDLRQLWDTIVRYRWTILSVAAVIFVSTIVATLLMRPVFRSTALVEIRPAQRSMIPLRAVDPAVGGRQREYLETQWRVLRSKGVGEAVIERLGLDVQPEFTGQTRQRGFLGGLLELLGVLDTMSESGREDPARVREEQWTVLRNFLDRVSISPIRDSNLVEVSFDSFSPELAARGANAIVEEYVVLSDARRYQSRAEAKRFLEREIAGAQARLERSERELNDFARRENIVDVDESTNLVSSRASELSSELTRLVSERIAAESLYRQVRNGRAAELAPVLENELIGALKEKHTQLSEEIRRLAKIYKPSYPKVEQLQASLREVEASIDREIRVVMAGIEAAYEKALSREALLREELETGKMALLDLKDRAVQYHILKRDWETNRELHAGLLEQMKQVGVSAGMGVGNVSTVDPAKVPVEPHRPRLLLNAGMALALGLGAGIALALLLAWLDDCVRTPEEFEAITGIVSLGCVPKLASGESVECVSHTRRRSPVSEALRSARTNLLAGSRKDKARVLQVSSALPGEGKTTTAANLAVVLAQSGCTVLLVDGDLRRPRIHEIFGTALSPGLADALMGRAEKRVHETAVPLLSVLPAGETPPDPVELLGSMNMDVLIESVGETYDFVLFDSAPLLGLADSVTVATKVSGVILVTSAEDSRREALREAVRRLRLVQAPLAGGLLNKADVRRPAYGYYADYGYEADDSREPAPMAAT